MVMLRICAFVGITPFVVLAAYMLWHAPRCTGPTQADVCPLAGALKAKGVNTLVHPYPTETKGK
jgi:hypothetical protein